jgi:hypothetical protein
MTVHLRSKRRVIGAAIIAARIGGLALLLLAIAGLPQLRPLMGRAATSLGTISSVLLAVASIVWLALIEVFLRFFDQYLSRN